MEFRPKRLAIKILLLLSILGILGGTFLFFLNQRKEKEISEEFTPSSKLAYGKGFTIVEYYGDRKVYSVSIDSFSIERARLGPFAIGPLRVAQFDKVNVDLYLDTLESMLGGKKAGDDRLKKELMDLESPISNIKKNLPFQAKQIRGIKFRDISFNLWRNEKRIFRISSETATLDSKTKDLIFTGHATMDAGKNGNLISYRIRWDRKTRFFRVTDPYYLIKDGNRVEGRGIETDYLFKKVTYLTSNK
jgi:hypothetical protein